MSGGAVLHSEHTFKASWKQPEDVDRYLRQLIEPPSVNVCAGKSPLGGIKIDADRDHEPDIQADMNRLPLPDSHFQTVIHDPPWKLGYYNRMTPFFECVRIAKPDARILYNARWLGESENTEIEEVVVRADDRWANVSTIAIHRKQPGQVTLDADGRNGGDA